MPEWPELEMMEWAESSPAPQAPAVDLYLTDTAEELAAMTQAQGWCGTDALEQAFYRYLDEGALEKELYRTFLECLVERETAFQAYRFPSGPCPFVITAPLPGAAFFNQETGAPHPLRALDPPRTLAAVFGPGSLPLAVKYALAAAENTLRGIRTGYTPQLLCYWQHMQPLLPQPLLLAAAMQDFYTSWPLYFYGADDPPPVLHYSGLCSRARSSFAFRAQHPVYFAGIHDDPRALLPALETAKRGRRRGFAARARTGCRTFLAPFVDCANTVQHPDPQAVDRDKSARVHKKAAEILAGGAVKYRKSWQVVNCLHHGALDNGYEHCIAVLRRGADGNRNFRVGTYQRGALAACGLEGLLNSCAKGGQLWLLIVEHGLKNSPPDPFHFALKSGHFYSQKTCYTFDHTPHKLVQQDSDCGTHSFCIRIEADCRRVELTEGWDALDEFENALREVYPSGHEAV